MKRCSVPFIPVTFSFAAGILLSRLDVFSLNGLFLTGLLLLGIIFVCINRTHISAILLVVLVMITGLFWSRAHVLKGKEDISRLSFYERSGLITLKGMVASDVEYRPFYSSEKTNFILRLEAVKRGRFYKKVTGKTLVSIYRHADLNYGDLIEVEGKLHPPFVSNKNEPFSYRDYLNIRGIDYIFSVKKTGAVSVISSHNGFWLRESSLRFRNRCKSIFERYLTFKEAGIMKAVVLGDRAQVPKHVKELFLRTGTGHILAISGLHVGIVSALIILLMNILPVSRRVVYGLTILLLLSYAFITGGRPSVVRATIMIMVVLLGLILETESRPLNTWALAALIILVLNPLNLFDVGFQLSFTCVGAIIVIYPIVSRLHSHIQRYNLRQLISSLSYSASIWIAIAGLIAYYFQIITPVSILVNLFVIPMIGVVVALGFALMATALLVPSIAFYVAVSLKLVLNILVAVVFLFDQFPATHFFIKTVSVWYLAGYYIMLGLILVVLSTIDKAAQL